MKNISLTLVLYFTHFISSGQIPCSNHWSKDSILNQQLDNILAKVSFDHTDSLSCNSSITDEFNYKWYIDFYNKQIGNYFSDARCINSAKRFYKERKDSVFDEIDIIQFELPQENLMLFKNKYGALSEGYRYFHLTVFTLYKYVIKGNNVYIVWTESYHPGRKNESFLDKVFKEIINSK